MTRKLAGFGLAFALAELAAAYLPPLASLLTAALFISLFLFAAFTQRRAARFALPAVAGLLAGLVWSAAYQLAVVKPAQSLAGQTYACTAIVQPDAETSWQPSNVRATLLITRLDGRKTSLKVYCTDLPYSEAGNIITGQFQLQPLRADSYRMSRYAKGIWLGASYQADYIWQGTSDALPYRLYHLRQAFAKRLTTYLPQNLAGVEAAMLLGEKSELTDEWSDTFRTAGIAHLLAVSGLHVALLCGLFAMGQGWRSRFSVPRVLLQITVLLLYMGLTGLPFSVFRAGVMFLIMLVGSLLLQPPDSLTALALAAIIIGVQQPFAPCDIGFQLSVCASAGILLFYEPLRHALARLGKIPPRICEGCALSTAAQVLVLPIILYNFHSFPLYFIPANLIVVPLLEWVIIGGLLAALSSFLLMPLTGGILQFADYFLWAALRLNGFISSLPEASFEAGSLSLAEGILYYIGVAVFCFKRKWERKGQYLLAGIIFAGAILLLAEWAARRETVLLAPDLGADTGMVLISGDAKIVYYKSSGISSAASGRELDSILGYHGIFDIDVLLLNLEEVKKPVPFEMDTRIKEIWAVGGKAETLAPFLIKDFKGTVRNLSPSRLRLKNGLTVITNGSALRVGKGSWDVYFAGNKNFSEGDSPHTAWVGGSNGFRRGVSEKELDRLRPEAAVYGGGGRFAGEDKDVFYLCNCPVAYTESEGMAELIWEKDGWRLLQERWDGNNGSKTNLIQLQNFIR